MINNRQTFLERLTGTRVLHDEDDKMHTASYPINTTPTPHAPMQNNIPEKRGAEEVEEDMGNDNSTEDYSGEDADDDADDNNGEPTLAIDMYESDNELVIQSMIAGVTPENLNITIARDMVTIKGKRVAPQGIPNEHYIDQELYWGSFSRDITLPFEIDTDGAEAVEKYGLLIIRLPRLDKGRSQELRVKSI